MGFAPARSRVFSFLRDGGGDFFISLIIILSIHTRWLLCLPVLRLRLRWDKCVASQLRYRYELSFSFRPTPSPRLFSLCLLNLVPRPRAWEALAAVDLRLRAWRRSACLLPCRAALSLPLVRYFGTVRPVGSYCLVVPSMSSRLPCRLAARHVSRFLDSPSCPTDGEWMAWCCRLLACLSHRTCCGVLVRECGFYLSVGFAAVMCAAS